MLKKILEHKKIVIAGIAIVLLALAILLIIKNVPDKPTDTDLESDKGEKQEEIYDGNGLTVNQDDEKEENSVDTSEAWDDTDDNDIQTGETVDDKTDNKTDDKTENNEENNTDDSSGNTTDNPTYENDVSAEDTSDDGSWGTFY